jgi:hypothetical protein
LPVFCKLGGPTIWRTHDNAPYQFDILEANVR